MDREAMMVTQYEQCYEHLREHNRHMWYIPFGTVSFIVALAIAAFYYIPDYFWYIRPIILLIGIIIHFCFLIRMIKHRYFARIWAKTIYSIEDEFQVKRILLFTTTEDNKDYWSKPEPSQQERCLGKWSAHLEKWSAHDATVCCMWGILVMLFIAFIISFVHY